jgi:hypothetical protein
MGFKSQVGKLAMPTVTSASWLARSAATVLLIALSPPATFAQPERAPAISLRVSHALNDAIAALTAERYDDARRAIGELRLDRLSRYERAKTEQVLFNIAYGERNYVKARQHLQNALESGGLNEQEAAVVRGEIERIEARLATTPPA